MTKQESVIIIGGGLAGLECGYILAKNGMRVTVVESGHNLGGSIQSFVRKGTQFDTGFHYVGALGEGESLNRLFRYFDLMGLPWVKLDEECFDKVLIGDEWFDFANGYERFVDTLCQNFPRYRAELTKYVSQLKTMGDHALDGLMGATTSFSQEVFSRSAYKHLNSIFNNPKLVQVLSGTSQKVELMPDTLPLYLFGVMNDSFIRSAWRLKGAGSQIADHLKASIEAMGGEVRLGAKATEILCNAGKAKGVVINGEERLSADWVISSMHPAATLALIAEEANLRRSYRNRLTTLENTAGAFTVNIRLKENAVPYRNHNIYLHREGCDVWYPLTQKVEHLMIHFAVPQNGGRYADSIDLLTLMNPRESAAWCKLRNMGVREEYNTLKQQKAEECIAFARRAIPEIESAIDGVYTSSPATYERWVGIPNGSAYGIRKDFNRPMQTLISPKTPITNLLLTGQNLNLHGVLGVSITSFYTCAEILGMDRITEELRNY